MKDKDCPEGCPVDLYSAWKKTRSRSDWPVLTPIGWLTAKGAARYFRTSKAKGWQLQKGRYRVRLKVDGKSICFGLYATAEEAHAMYLRQRRAKFGF